MRSRSTAFALMLAYDTTSYLTFTFTYTCPSSHLANDGMQRAPPIQPLPPTMHVYPSIFPTLPYPSSPYPPPSSNQPQLRNHTRIQKRLQLPPRTHRSAICLREHGIFLHEERQEFGRGPGSGPVVLGPDGFDLSAIRRK